LSTEEQPLATIMGLFEKLFFKSFQTCLLAGAAEPIYIPAGVRVDRQLASEINVSGLAEAAAYHRLFFRHDYLSSALHESAHWCIAGEQRRAQLDFGYWYSPDGRTEQQQQLFEQAEVKPQALEWMLSVACGQRFRISADNLASAQGESRAFATAVSEQAQRWCDTERLPSRGQQFILALAARFNCPDVLSQHHFRLDKLG